MPAPAPLSASDLASLASAVYGPRWQSPLARDLDVNLRTVQRWAQGGIDRSTTADGVRQFLEERRRSITNAPPADPAADRDDAAYEMVRPRIEALLDGAVAAGWHPAEVMTALLAVVVDEMREGAGTPATMQTLRQAIDSLKAQRAL